MSMRETAENVAKKYKIARKEQEEFAVRSHRLATAARQAGKFTDEIIAIDAGKEKVVSDGCIREETSMEALASLKPAFDEKGSVTAGTSSPLTDGASACLVTSEDYAKANGLKILARIKSSAVVGCAPEIMGIGPVAATERALKRAGLEVDDAIQRARGRTDPSPARVVLIQEKGSRYIDFLLPGILGLNLMGTGIWGVGFSHIDAVHNAAHDTRHSNAFPCH